MTLHRQMDPDAYPGLPLPAPSPTLPPLFASDRPLPLPQPDSPWLPVTPFVTPSQSLRYYALPATPLPWLPATPFAIPSHHLSAAAPYPHHTPEMPLAIQ